MATVKRLVVTCDRAGCSEETTDSAGWGRLQLSMRRAGAQPMPRDLCPTHVDELRAYMDGVQPAAGRKRTRLRPVG